MLSKIRNDLLSVYPRELVDGLIQTYQEITQNYFLKKFEPSELNGGKFCEVVYRIIEFEINNGVYTPIGTPIPNMIDGLRNFEQTPRSATNSSYRIHIPRILQGIYNIRSQRGVGHIGGAINPNYTDATLIVENSSWILAELFRLHYQCDVKDAQRIVEILMSRPIQLVVDTGKVKRVLIPSLQYKQQVLILLSTEHPNSILDSELIKYIEPKNPNDFRKRVLLGLHADRFIEYDQNSGSCSILSPGFKYVEENISRWTKQLT